ncbi:MAG: glutamine synthetase family protein [Burkholderiaceae bacterium]|nr:glutamine synthetase family protein [Burkholderiaceae bacterium]
MNKEEAIVGVAEQIQAHDLELIRFAWCDVHGVVRCKSLSAAAAMRALDNGVGMVSTLFLKDAVGRTVYKIFEPETAAQLPDFAFASNVQLMPLPHTFKVLPWAEKTGWILCDAVFPNGEPVGLDTRHQLKTALGNLAKRGLGMVCGLEVELHIYRLDEARNSAYRNPDLAAWPGPAPEVSLIHPGFNLLSESCLDMADEPLRIVQRTAQALGLPLLSLEIELGPSQVEVVFDATDALTAADNMVLFRSAVGQALGRAGYYATFMCRPPFENIMASGWHLHQSLVDLATGENAMMRPVAPTPTSTPTQTGEATELLSDLGAHYLAGLLTHARGMTVMCTPTTNGFERFKPNALAPHAIVWGRDNRGAMLRVIGQAGDAATRIENRLGEPAANPYLYMAAQIHAGLAGIDQRLVPPRATADPYGQGATDGLVPNNLGEALDALTADPAMRAGFGDAFINYYEQIKRPEQQRYEAAEDKRAFHTRAYFSRI